MCEGISVCITDCLTKLSATGFIAPEHLNSVRTELLQITESSFEQFRTEHKRFSYFLNKGSYIPPTEIVIGQRLDRIRKGGIVSTVPVTCTEQFIPLRHVLTKFLSLPNLLSTLHRVELKAN